MYSPVSLLGSKADIVIVVSLVLLVVALELLSSHVTFKESGTMTGAVMV